MLTFHDLAVEFLSNSTLQQQWGYHRPGAPANAYTHTINQTGCEALRGTGSEYYNWIDSANTLNTWVLPFTGLLLQAPFDSNNASGTFWAIARWTGGCVGSLSYILWNMRSSANCAAFIDKGTKRNDLQPAVIEDEKEGKRRSEYASYRDAFFLLSVMNQYTVNVKFNGASAEKLLKVALFSNVLELPLVAGGAIEEVREALARDTREAQKKGTVQCFLSMLWFIFGMVISIQQSFGVLGQDAPAQNLALGLAMVWFPILMLCTVVDRNPSIPEVTQRQINTFLGLVRAALIRDAGQRRESHRLYNAKSRVSSFASVVTGSPIKSLNVEEALACQTRVSRSATLVQNDDDEHNNWFESKECDTADLHWIEAISDPGLDGADFFTGFAGQGRKLWHYGVAHPLLGGIEKDGIIDARRGWMYDPNARLKLISTANWERKDRLHSWDLREFWQISAALVVVWSSVLAALILAYFTPTVGLGCRALGYLVFGVNCTGEAAVEMLIWAITPHHKYGTQFYQRTRFYGKWFLRFAEVVNMIWLLYIIFAQAFGSYNTCRCKCSNYGIGGGFIDLNVVLNGAPESAKKYWIVGTTLGCAVMVISFMFIAWEWVTQSHMSTENYNKAMQGLKRTRQFKSWTRCIAPFQA